MAEISESKLAYIFSELNKIEYGSLRITIHNKEIIQVDVTEKNRLTTNNKSDQFVINKSKLEQENKERISWQR